MMIPSFPVVVFMEKLIENVRFQSRESERERAAVAATNLSDSAAAGCTGVRKELVRGFLREVMYFLLFRLNRESI